MKKKYIVFVVILVGTGVLQLKYLTKKVQADKPTSVSWKSTEGVKRFENAKYKGDFFRLASYYSPQRHAMECGLASARIVINYIYKTDKKPTPHHENLSLCDNKRGLDLQYDIFTEDDLVAVKIEKGFPSVADIRGNGKMGHGYIGIDIWDYPRLFHAHGLKAEYFNITNAKSDKANFVKMLKNILQDDGKFIIGFFKNHISPVVALDEKSNSVLILDVEQHATDWYWVDLEFLLQNMSTSKGHGYVIISK